MRALVIGAGAVGARTVRQLVERPEVTRVLVVDEDPARQAAVVDGSGPKARGADRDAPADVVVIDPGRSVRDAMNIVTAKRLRHLPVVRDGHLMGMVSGGDLTRSIVAEEEEVIDTLYEYIRGSYPA